MSKETLLKLFGFRSCHICRKFFTEGKTITAIDDQTLRKTNYHFCFEHAPDFGCDLAIGHFGKYYVHNFKCFVYKSDFGGGSSSNWSQIEQEKVVKWLSRIYK